MIQTWIAFCNNKNVFIWVQQPSKHVESRFQNSLIFFFTCLFRFLVNRCLDLKGCVCVRGYLTNDLFWLLKQVQLDVLTLWMVNFDSIKMIDRSHQPLKSSKKPVHANGLNYGPRKSLKCFKEKWMVKLHILNQLVLNQNTLVGLRYLFEIH